MTYIIGHPVVIAVRAKDVHPLAQGRIWPEAHLRGVVVQVLFDQTAEVYRYRVPLEDGADPFAAGDELLCGPHSLSPRPVFCPVTIDPRSYIKVPYA